MRNMDPSAATIDSFRSLPFDALPAAWINDVHQHDFVDVDQSQCEELFAQDLGEPLRRTIEICRQWIGSHSNASQQSFWLTLSDADITAKNVMALIYGVLVASDKDSLKESSILAATLYFRMLRIPGSSAYQFMSPSLFGKCLDLLATWSNKMSSEEGDGDKKKPAKKRKRNVEPATGVISPGAHSLLVDLLKDLVLLMESVSLRENVLRIIEILTSLIGASASFLSGPVASLAFTGIDNTINPIHGDDSRKNVNEIMLNFIPMLLLKHPNGNPIQANQVPKPLLNVRAAVIDFISHWLDRGDDALLEAGRILVQNLCAKAPHRANYRARVVQGVCLLLRRFPVPMYARLIMWVYTFGRTSEASNRLTGLEVFTCLTLDPRPLSDSDLAGLSSDLRDVLTPSYYIQHILTRTFDISPAVTSKALLCIAECLKDGRHGEIFQDLLRVESKRSEVVLMVLERVRDEKLSVRKAGIQCLQNLVLLIPSLITPKICDALSECCNDVALSVRKQALSCITEVLIKNPNNENFQNVWLESVPPSLFDCESSVTEKCLAMMEQVLLGSVLNDERLGWDLLYKIATDSKETTKQCLQMACSTWEKQNSVPRGIYAILKEKCTARPKGLQAQSSWLLLSYLPLLDSLHVSFIADEYFESPSSSYLCTLLTTALRYLDRFTPDEQRSLETDLARRLVNLESSNHQAITAAIQILHKIDRKNSNWSSDALKSALNVIETSSSLEHLKTALFTLGELAPVIPQCFDDDWFDLLRSFSTRNDAVAHAYAVIALGKMCLVVGRCVESSVNYFVELLEPEKSSAVRNNAVIVLGDLCKRYTSMVEPFLPNVMLCLRDEEAFVRKTTLTVVAGLLKDGYIKFRGALFCHLLYSLVDEKSDIRNFGYFFLSRRLDSRNAKLFHHQFLDCVFSLNSYYDHPVYNKFSQSKREEEVFSLKDNKKARFRVYAFILNQLSDECKLQLSEKIVQEILGGVVDETIKLGSNFADQVLRDALEILSSPDIKLSQLKRKSGLAEEEEDDVEGPAAAMEKAKTKIITKLVKMNIVENIIPVLVSLKHVLQKAMSPLVTALMTYLRTLVQDYKNEIDEIFAADPQTACEIRFDLRVFEERQAAAVRQPSSSQAPRHRSITENSPIRILNQFRSPATGELPRAKLKQSALRERQRAAILTPRTKQQQATTPVSVTLFKTPVSSAMSKSRPVSCDDRRAVSRFNIDSIVVDAQRGVSTPANERGFSAVSFRASTSPIPTGNVVYLESPFKAPSKPHVWEVKLPNEDK